MNLDQFSFFKQNFFKRIDSCQRYSKNVAQKCSWSCVPFEVFCHAWKSCEKKGRQKVVTVRESILFTKSPNDKIVGEKVMKIVKICLFYFFNFSIHKIKPQTRNNIHDDFKIIQSRRYYLNPYLFAVLVPVLTIHGVLGKASSFLTYLLVF